VAGLQQSIDEARRAGLIRRRLRGGYRVTLAGSRYVRDAARRDADVRAELSKLAEVWETSGKKKAEKREGLVSLVLLAWERDETAEADALAGLRSQGLDPLAPEIREKMHEEFGFDPLGPAAERDERRQSPADE
jgi:hypothetical protein